MNTEQNIENTQIITNIVIVEDAVITEQKIIVSTENKNSFDWVWYVMGLLTGMLAVIAVTTSFGYVLLGGIIGFIIAALFLNNIVKGREY